MNKDDERAGESVSIEKQKLMLTKYCAEQGWNDYSVYCDDGVSGPTFDRPSVSKLIEDAKEGLINLILCKDLSRFGICSTSSKAKTQARKSRRSSRPMPK